MQPRQTLGLIHASPAAIAPVARYYRRNAPEFALVNLLDDGILTYFERADRSAAHRRIRSLVSAVNEEYGAAAAIVTCSSAEADYLRGLQAEMRIPVIKIDEPMARCAAAAGRRVLAVVTFEPTVETTRCLLAAHGAGEVRVCVVPDAYAALLDGDAAGHDRRVIDAADAAAGCDCIVLAQVSMAHLRDEVQRRAKIPVFSSLETSLEAVRKSLSETS
jgi:aspartate/glutamate racemase